MVRVVVLDRESGETFTRGHRRREPGRDLRPGHARARLRGADRLPLLLPRHRGVRRGRPRRARRPLERPARRAPVEHAGADPLGARRAASSSPARAASSGTRCSRRSRTRAALTRADWDVTFPPPAGLEARPRPARGGVDGRRRRRGRPAGARPRSTSAASQHAAELGAPLVVCSTDYVFDGTKRDAVRRVGRAVAARRLRPHEAARRGGRGRARRGSCARRGSSAGRRTTSCARCCGSAPSATRSRSSTTSAAARPTSAISPRRRGRCSSCRTASTTSPRDGDCTWADFAEAIFEEAGLDCRVRRITTAEFGARAPRPAYSVLRSERGAPELPHWRDGPARVPRAARYPASDARARHRRRRVHRLALRRAASPRRATRSSSSTSSPTRATARTSRASSTSSTRATSPTPTRSRARRSGVDAIVNFAAETHVDRSILGPAEFILTDVLGTQVLLDHARHHGLRLVHVSTDEVYGDIPLGAPACDRGRAAAPVEPVLRVEGRRRPAGARLRPHLRRRRARSRAARTPTGRASTRRSSCRSSSRTRSTASRCRSTATASSAASGCTSRTTAPAIELALREGAPARRTTSAARSARTSRSSGASST